MATEIETKSSTESGSSRNASQVALPKATSASIKQGTKADAGKVTEGKQIVNIKKNKEMETGQTKEEEDLERLAMEELLLEAKRGAARAKEIGITGWLKPVVPPTNKRFLETTIKRTLPRVHRYRSRSRSRSRSRDRDKQKRKDSSSRQRSRSRSRSREKDSRSRRYKHTSTSDKSRRDAMARRSSDSKGQRSKKSKEGTSRQSSDDRQKKRRESNQVEKNHDRKKKDTESKDVRDNKEEALETKPTSRENKTFKTSKDTETEKLDVTTDEHETKIIRASSTGSKKLQQEDVEGERNTSKTSEQLHSEKPSTSDVDQTADTASKTAPKPCTTNTAGTCDTVANILEITRPGSIDSTSSKVQTKSKEDHTKLPEVRPDSKSKVEHSSAECSPEEGPVPKKRRKKSEKPSNHRHGDSSSQGSKKKKKHKHYKPKHKKHKTKD